MTLKHTKRFRAPGDQGQVRGRALAAACTLVLLAALPGAVMAQPVVQKTPGGPSLSLNAALSRLARDPRDLSALIDAGNAALMMGDVDAAVGFFARADQLSPNNMRVKAGLAGALVRNENPYDAIPLFTEAEKAGALDPLLVADRGLAYDLVGDPANAQRYYRQALAAGPNDETTRRLALSQAISGDKAGMEATLAPLLQRQDKGAWRTRAFALAILNQTENAVAIANQTMPTALASGIAPYLRYMPRLTAAQQVAAATFGRFPRASEIGQDDPRVALYAPPKRFASADGSLVPAGEPFGRGRSRREPRDARQPVGPAPGFALAAGAPAGRNAPPEPMPGRQSTAAPALAAATMPQRPAPITPRSAPPQSAPAQPALARPVPNPVQPPRVAIAATGFNLSNVSAAASQSAAPRAPVQPVKPAPSAVPAISAPEPAPVRVAAAAPAVVPVVAAPPQPRTPPPAPKPKRVVDAFADFMVPTGPAAPAPGAVDVRKLKPKLAEPAKVIPPKPVHPSRIWVQVGTGRDTRALGFTWRALVKDNPELFRAKAAAISDWGRTNRLLAGPFATEAAADSFLARLKKAQVDAFVWTSPAGQVVDDLPGR